MSLIKRKVNITFLSADSVIITNMFYQKTFNLKKTIAVDLHFLNTINVENIEQYSQKSRINSPFFVCFEKVNKNQYKGLVVFRPGKDRMEILELEEDVVSLSNNNKNFSATVYIED